MQSQFKNQTVTTSTGQRITIKDLLAQGAFSYVHLTSDLLCVAKIINLSDEKPAKTFKSEKIAYGRLKKH